jgi:hypothetical protein
MARHGSSIGAPSLGGPLAAAGDYRGADLISLGVAITGGRVLLIARFATEPLTPLELPFLPDDADELAATLHSHATHLDHTLANHPRWL